MGPDAVGVQFRYLPYQNETLWSCYRICFTVVVEYVESTAFSTESCDPDGCLADFVVSYNTPIWVTKLGWKLFIMYAAMNIGVMGTFSLLIPETKGLSLEEMDIIFGAVNAETRLRDIERQQVFMADGADVEGSHTNSSDYKSVTVY